MNVRTLCLAILFETDATGYEIRKRSTEGDYAYFVEASYGAIYPALSRLEDEGSVKSHVEQQDGRPAKKVYKITDKGRRQLIGELGNDLDPDVFRSEFLLFVRFAPHLPADLVEQRLIERLAQIDEELAHFETLLDEYEDPADQWVIHYGQACFKVARSYIATHMSELIDLARQGLAVASR